MQQLQPVLNEVMKNHQTYNSFITKSKKLFPDLQDKLQQKVDITELNKIREVINQLKAHIQKYIEQNQDSQDVMQDLQEPQPNVKLNEEDNKITMQIQGLIADGLIIEEELRGMDSVVSLILTVVEKKCVKQIDTEKIKINTINKAIINKSEDVEQRNKEQLKDLLLILDDQQNPQLNEQQQLRDIQPKQQDSITNEINTENNQRNKTKNEQDNKNITLQQQNQQQESKVQQPQTVSDQTLNSKINSIQNKTNLELKQQIKQLQDELNEVQQQLVSQISMNEQYKQQVASASQEVQQMNDATAQEKQNILQSSEKEKEQLRKQLKEAHLQNEVLRKQLQDITVSVNEQLFEFETVKNENIQMKKQMQLQTDSLIMAQANIMKEAKSKQLKAEQSENYDNNQTKSEIAFSTQIQKLKNKQKQQLETQLRIQQQQQQQGGDDELSNPEDRNVIHTPQRLKKNVTAKSSFNAKNVAKVTDSKEVQQLKQDKAEMRSIINNLKQVLLHVSSNIDSPQLKSAISKHVENEDME